MNSFSRFKLLVRSICYFRAANLAVVAGWRLHGGPDRRADVGTACGGACRSGGKRLGFVDHVMMSPRFVDQAFAKRLADSAGFKERFESVTPGILLRGGWRGGWKGAHGGGADHRAGGQVSGGTGDAVLNGVLADVIQGGGVRFSLPRRMKRRAIRRWRGGAAAIRSRHSGGKIEIAPAGEFLDLFNLTAGSGREEMRG